MTVVPRELILIIVLFCTLMNALARPTIYMKNDNDKLEPRKSKPHLHQTFPRSSFDGFFVTVEKTLSPFSYLS